MCGDRRQCFVHAVLAAASEPFELREDFYVQMIELSLLDVEMSHTCHRSADQLALKLAYTGLYERERERDYYTHLTARAKAGPTHKLTSWGQVKQK